jgi:hypothetical protein
MIRACFVVVAILVLFPSHAIPCWMVRKAVAQYGEGAAEAWARSKGFSNKEIEKARLCLK